MAKDKKDAKKAGQGIRVPGQTVMPLSGLNMAPYNPRIMPPPKMAALKASLMKHGFVSNLVVQRSSPKYGEMVLIGGHQRVKAARELCEERGFLLPDKLPVAVLDVGDAEAKQLNVALNNIEGEFDPHKLGELFADILPLMTVDDVLATGFTASQLDEVVQLVLPPEQQADALEAAAAALDVAGFAKSITLSVEFDSVEARDQAKAILKEVQREGSQPGAALLGALKAARATGKLGKAKKRAAA